MAFKVKVINGKAPSGGVGGVSDADLSNIGVNFFTQGIATKDALKVEQSVTPSMVLKIKLGTIYIPKSDGSINYSATLDADTTYTVPNNSTGNPRIGAIVAKIDLGATPNNFADNIATIMIVHGASAASPVAPTDGEIQTAVGSGNAFLRLANVTIANGATTLDNAVIADARSGVKFKLLSGYFQYNLSTDKLQFSHDGVTYNDLGSGTVTPTFTITGNIATGTSLAPLLIAPFNLKILKAFARVKTAPSGADLIFDINKNGTTIWSTQANRLKILDGITSGTQSTFNTVNVDEGDYLSLDVDQVGSSIAGANATVELYCQAR